MTDEVKMPYRPVLPPRRDYVERDGKYYPCNTQGLSVEQFIVRHEETSERLDTSEEYLGDIISTLDFSLSEKMFTVLVKLPATLFPEYVPDPNKRYDKGEVVRTSDTDKYMAQNQTTTSVHPSENPGFKLFRDSGRYPWVREEFCLRGFERYYDDGDPGRTGWYRVITTSVDSATPPPNDYQNWEKIDS